ncbi:MAG: hypothetical protein QOE82_2605 [Thermoanaerobaculia bacterium]|jgi:ribosomal protein S18 acetylase RimI-like enzyme|nr:hypothetical protein [Thermoanaerobaculia bacterium]
MSISIRPMHASDVDAVAALHQAAFPGFFLAFLGRRFLREIYRALMTDEEHIAFVASDGDRIAGFVAGTNSSGFYRRAAKRYWLRFGLASVGALLRKPSIAARLVRALYAPPKPATKGALLMALAVDPGMKRSGLGRLLTHQFVEEARHRGLSAVVLTTDRFDNEAATAFYQSQGFEVARQYETPEGRAMTEYILHL